MTAWLPRPTSVPIRPPTSRPATTVLRQRNVPEAIRSLSTLAKPDYVDLFTVATVAAADRSPEQWARPAIEDAAVAGQFIWRVVLGLRLERRPSLDHVGGWKIGDRDDNWIRLEAASWFLTAQIVVQVDPEQVSVATFIRNDGCALRPSRPVSSSGTLRPPPMESLQSNSSFTESKHLGPEASADEFVRAVD